MIIEIMTKVQMKKFIKEEVERKMIILYKDLDKIIKKLNLLREEFVCLEIKNGKRK